MDSDRAAEIVDALPAELRQVDLAAVLGVPLGHIEKMRGLNRIPKPDRRVVWRRDSIREWLIERLVSREADLAAARSADNTARATFKRPKQLALSPLYPFLGIY